MGVCTVGSASMTGKHSGDVARIKEKVPNVIQAQYIVHGKVFVAKDLGQSFSEVSFFSKFQTIIDQCSPGPVSMFSKLCDDLGLEHSSLLLHTKVRWLSRGKIVESVLDLQEELLIFNQKSYQI